MCNLTHCTSERLSSLESPFQICVHGNVFAAVVGSDLPEAALVCDLDDILDLGKEDLLRLQKMLSSRCCYEGRQNSSLGDVTEEGDGNNTGPS